MTSSSAHSVREVLPDSMLNRWFNARDYVADDNWRDLDPKRTAVLLIDLINWQAHPDGGNLEALRSVDPSGAQHLSDRCSQTLVPRLVSLVGAAREAGIQVVHATLASRRTDFADIVPAFRSYLAASGAMEGTWAAQPLAELGPDPADLVVVKSGSSAFTSDLHTALEQRDIQTLICAGVVTNACVLATVASGFDLGYRQYLVSDCTATLTASDQSAAERFIGTYLAEVVTADATERAIRALSS
jgi:nicotinamidase-related amidase